MIEKGVPPVDAQVAWAHANFLRELTIVDADGVLRARLMTKAIRHALQAAGVALLPWEGADLIRQQRDKLDPRKHLKIHRKMGWWVNSVRSEWGPRPAKSNA
jgi:hypothetical protein